MKPRTRTAGMKAIRVTGKRGPDSSTRASSVNSFDVDWLPSPWPASSVAGIQLMSNRSDRGFQQAVRYRRPAHSGGLFSRRLGLTVKKLNETIPGASDELSRSKDIGNFLRYSSCYVRLAFEAERASRYGNGTAAGNWSSSGSPGGCFCPGKLEARGSEDAL